MKTEIIKPTTGSIALHRKAFIIGVGPQLGSDVFFILTRCAAKEVPLSTDWCDLLF